MACPAHVIKVFLLLAVGVKTQNEPCDPLDQVAGGQITALFANIQESSDFELVRARTAGGTAMDPYQSRLRVNGVIGSTVDVQFNAEDAQCLTYFEVIPLNNQIYIRLKVGIDRDGGTASSLDDTDSINCQLECRPTAGNRNTILLTIKISILDINDNPPVFLETPYTKEVNELTPIGTIVFANISASDKDGQQEVDFSIISGDGSELPESNGVPSFVIDNPRGGKVTVNNILDFETLYYNYNRVYFNLTILAKDTGGPPLSASTVVSLKIIDGDDLPPAFIYPGCINFQRYYPICIEPEFTTSVISRTVEGTLLTYPWPEPAGSVPVAIRARDQDTLNAEILFYFEPSTYSGNFELLPQDKTSQSGVDYYSVILSQIQAIDRANVKDFYLIIRAQENTTNRRFATTQIRVRVDPANNFDPILNTNTGQFIGWVYENSPVGTLIANQAGNRPLQLLVTDNDVAQGDPTPSYSFSIDGNSSPFTVTSEGFISVSNAVLDFESRSQYMMINVVVREVSTTALRSSTSAVTINVRDVNDFAPTFLSGGYVATVPEGNYATSRRFLTAVSAADGDTGLNGVVTYQIISVTNAGSGKFFIQDTTSGPGAGGASIYVIGTVARGEQYAITVRGTDGASPGSLSGDTVVIVTVTFGGNQSPQIPSSQYELSVSEGVDVNSNIFLVPAKDPEDNTLRYIISSGNTVDDFSISSSGQITNVNKLDRETTPSYSLRVLVSDNQVPALTATTTVSITLTDINDNTPRFTGASYTFTVREGLVDKFVGLVTATDRDEAATERSSIRYSLSSTFFQVDQQDGRITTTVALDYESQSRHLLTVVASDLASDSRSSTVTVTVNVEDVEDYVPRFLPTTYQATVPENENGRFAVQVSAIDLDLTENVQYQFLSGDYAKFSIAPDGRITTSEALDYETTNFYRFLVTTTDGRSSNIGSATATVSVLVQDRNDFTPVITLPIGRTAIPAFTKVFTELGLAQATDQDPVGTDNSRVRFSIDRVTPTTGISLFYIHPETGRLITSLPLTTDVTRPHQYQILIQATDLGSPPLAGTALFTVDVRWNKFSPYFDPEVYRPQIPHTSTVGDVVTTITAKDRDTVFRYGDITYSMNCVGNGPEYFAIDPNSGTISVRKNLMPDTAISYTMEVVATDGGGLSNTTVVEVTVIRNIPDAGVVSVETI